MKCICKPENSGFDPDCKRCHKKGYTAVRTHHDPIKPAEVKQHKALPTRELPFVSGEPLSTKKKTKAKKGEPDPYADFVDVLEENNV